MFRQLVGTSEHTPPRQYGLGTMQTLPQAPQLVPLALMSISQPSAGFLLQSAKLYLQLPIPHTPWLQVAVALTGTGQALPQAPQLSRSRAMGASQPLATLPSQLSHP